MHAYVHSMELPCNLQWQAFTNVQPCDMRDALSGCSAVYVHDDHAIHGFAVRLSLNLALQ